MCAVLTLCSQLCFDLCPLLSPQLNPEGHLPGYGGHCQSAQFRFGKSYGQITADALSQCPPAGRRPGYGTQTARF